MMDGAVMALIAPWQGIWQVNGRGDKVNGQSFDGIQKTWKEEA